MKTLLLTGAAAILATALTSEHAQSKPARVTFLVVFRPGPAFLPGKPLLEQPLKEHGRYILSLHVRGALKFAGPFGDDSGGAAVFEAADEAEAKAIVAADPAVTSGIFLADLRPWTLVDWEARAKK